MIHSDKDMIDLTEEDIAKEKIHDLEERSITTLAGLVRAYPKCVVTIGMKRNEKGEDILVAVATLETDQWVGQYRATMIQNEAGKRRKPSPDDPTADNDFSEYIESGLTATFVANIKEDQAKHETDEYSAIFSNVSRMDKHDA